MKSYKQWLLETSSNRFEDYIKSNTITYSGFVFHGTYLRNLYEILSTSSIHGNSHGEIRDSDTFSTSINDNMINKFSDTNSGLAFEVNELKIFVIPEWFLKFYTDSSLGEDVDETLAKENIEKYNIPLDRFGEIKENYLGDILRKLGIKAGCHEYMKDTIISNNYGHNDESEIIIFDPDWLLNNIGEIYVNGETFEDKDEAIKYIEDNFDLEELEWQEKYRD